MVNQERAAAGLNALTLSSQLTTAAEKYSQYMAAANFFAHDGPDGSTPQTRQQAAGYTGAVVWGENIAAGQPDPQSVMTAWMNSPGHRANILFRGFTEIGIGVYVAPGSQYGIYWTQEFGARAQGSGSGLPSTVVPPPVSVPSLDAISPAQGAVGDVVTLSGSRFGSVAGSVSFAGVLGQVVSWSDTQVKTRVPAGASSGSVYVQATNGLSNGRGFTVLTASAPPPSAPPPAAPPATTPPSTGGGSGASTGIPQPVGSSTPAVTFFYPASVRPGSRVTIYGRSFGQTRGSVLLNGAAVTIGYWYDTLIGITIPANATSGPLVVQAAAGTVTAGTLTVIGSSTPAPAPTPTPAPPTNNGGTGSGASTTPPVQLPTPTPAPTGQPMITAVSPSVAAPGGVVALQGSGFGTRGWVRFGRRLLPVVSWSDTSISVQLPPYTHARAYLVVIRSDGRVSNPVLATIGR
jgi:hypothetical protein